MTTITYSHAGRLIEGEQCAAQDCTAPAVFNINESMYCGKDAKTQWYDDL